MKTEVSKITPINSEVNYKLFTYYDYLLGLKWGKRQICVGQSLAF